MKKYQWNSEELRNKGKKYSKFCLMFLILDLVVFLVVHQPITNLILLVLTTGAFFCFWKSWNAQKQDGRVKPKEG